MDPITQLTEEHVTFRTALKKLEDPHGASGTRASRFAEVAHLLAVHSAGEEEVIYPQLQSLADDVDDEGMIAHAFEEHHLVDVLVDEIRGMDAEDPAWTAKVHVLRESLEHHIEEEQEELFPKLREAFDDEEMAELGDEMAEARAEAERWAEEHPDSSAQDAAIARASAESESE